MQGMDPLAIKNGEDEMRIHYPYSSKRINAEDLVLGQAYKIFFKAEDLYPTNFAGTFVYTKRENGYNYFQDIYGKVIMLSNRNFGAVHGNVIAYREEDFGGGKNLLKLLEAGGFFKYLKSKSITF